MVLLVPRKDPLVVIDDPTTSGTDHFVERVVFHPSRGSIVCVKGDTLEELDVVTGALLCHITFDLLTTSNLDLILPAGSHFVVGLLQSRFLVVWDLEDAVLLATSDADKLHGTRRVTALATSLCADRWLFFNAEGSNNVRVTRVDSQRPAREILRKSAIRGGSVVSLTYSTEHHLLSSGCNDGTIQVWSISSDEVDASSGRKGQETDFATPLFAVQLVQSPVVEIVIGTCSGCGTNGSSSNLFLAAGYQNRRVDVVAMNGQAHTCVASTTLTPPHTMDFSRLSGSLTLAIHTELPVLLVHWRSSRSEYGLDVIAAWELVHGGSLITSPRGGAGGSNIGGGAMTDWWPVANSLALRGRPSLTDGALTVLATDITLWQNSLAVYASTAERRALFIIDIQPTQSSSTVETEPKSILALSTTTQLTLAQYHDYPTGLPSSQLQIAVKTSAKGNPVLKLQRFSQLSGRVTGSSDQLPDWKSERGIPLVPFQVLGNSHESAVCIKLREKGQDAATNAVRPSMFSFAVLDLDVMVDTAMSDVVIEPDDESGEVSHTSLPAIELKYGSLQHDARDVCFVMISADNDAPKSPVYLLLVLSKAGDMINFMTTRDPNTESDSKMKLNLPVQRVFATPLQLPTNSSFQSAVACKLLYLVESTSQEQLVLSGEDLSVPVENSPSWKCGPNESVVDVQWNSSSCPQIGSPDSHQRLLLAVTTTRRVVVLSADLHELCVYNFENDLLGRPESLLWVSQTLVYVTTGNQIRFVTPVANHFHETSRLLCSIAAELDIRPGFTRSSIQLVSLCGDRLCYAVSNPVTLYTRATLHSVALCEPLLLGFAESTPTLRHVFERETVAFALMNDDSDRPVCSISDAVLETAYHAFGWKAKVLKVLKTLISSDAKASAVVGAVDGAAPAAPSSNYNRTSLLSRAVMGSILLDAHRWEEFLRVFLAHDPALEEYVVATDSDGAAKLPSRMGPTARRFRQLAAVFESIGQPDWAMRCLDLSGDDEALLTMLRKFDTSSFSEVLDSLQKSWIKLNLPLSAITKAAMGQIQQDSQSTDPFSVLCCETLTQPIRRGRLLNSVAPLDRLKLPSVPSDKHQNDGANDTIRAGTLSWKRLAPEDASEWLGVSTKTRLATTEPRALNYSIFAAEAAVGGVLLGVDASLTATAFSPSAPAAAEAVSAKMTIGPFQDEEDAVVAYWRFEEGATAAEKQTETASPDGIECLDTSKRENTLRLLGGAVNLVESSAPVDRGEPGRIPEEFALRFPSSDSPSSSLPASGWGAQCPVRPGSTLDVGTTFDEDPYRREFTFEVWLRNYKLYEQVQKLAENGEEAPASLSGGVRQQLLARKRVETLDDGLKGGDVSGPANWEFVIDEDDFLVFTFGSQQVRSTQKLEHLGNQGWRHVAFTVDVSAPQRVGLKLFIDGRCVGESQTTPSNQSVSKPSKLLLGWRLQDYEMTEVRLWATARSADQLSDMRENYLGMAEAKRRMKIAIHQRNCTCEKCVSRRAQSVAVAGATGAPRLGLSLGTPLAPPSRQRRIVPQAKTAQ